MRTWETQILHCQGFFVTMPALNLGPTAFSGFRKGLFDFDNSILFVEDDYSRLKYFQLGVFNKVIT
jgi:hypothetical protein